MAQTTPSQVAISKDPVDPEHDPSKAAFARFLVRSKAVEDIIKVPPHELSPEIVDPNNLNDQGIPAKSTTPGTVDPTKLKVGIIGAGIAGLYTALLLQSQNIPYEILEANPDRVGGRLYTHYFGKREDGTHQYYDIGAMRFPNSPIMARTFKLIKETDTARGDYIMSHSAQPMRYNDTTKVLGTGPDKWKNDPFGVSRKKDGPVPYQTVSNPQTILDDAYFPYRRKIKRSLKAYNEHMKNKPVNPGKDDSWESDRARLLEELEMAWQYLMQHDKFSLRDYLSFVENQDDETIHWLETINAGTGWFDQAFSENVLESLAFDYGSSDEAKFPGDPPEEHISWYYIKDGSYKLAENTLRKLNQKPEMGKQVTGMKLDGLGQDTKVEVYIRGEEKPRRYDTVFCSTTFAAMQKMDLTGLRLPYPMKAAIRSLRYDPSTKVAIQFKEAWWIKSPRVEQAGGLTGIKGGLGKTDMPLRTCVYPSYNLEDNDGRPAVLLCSYTWSSDSERIASMINPVSTGTPIKSTAQDGQDQFEPLLRETMVDNLARLHSLDDEVYEKMKVIINDLWITHHAYDWSKDPYTCGGAFALYSPSQFRNMYPNIVRPAADSRFHVIGEAASAHHAWVAGALDSAARGVHMMLERFKLHKIQEALKGRWGEVGEVDDDTAYLQVALGMLDRKFLIQILSQMFGSMVPK